MTHMLVSEGTDGVSNTAVLEGPKCSSLQRWKMVSASSPRKTEKQRNRKNI